MAVGDDGVTLASANGTTWQTVNTGAVFKARSDVAGQRTPLVRF